jgi:hypothetical protein
LLRAAHRANQFEFELDGAAIAILGILNQKYHQECDDRRTCVDDQLPRIAELEYRACDAPDYDDQSGDEPDGPWLAPSTWRSRKKAMNDKSRCHLLSGFRLLFIAGRQR